MLLLACLVENGVSSLKLTIFLTIFRVDEATDSSNGIDGVFYFLAQDGTE